MPSTEKVERSKLTGVIDSLLDRRSHRDKDGNPDFLSIIEFIERFKLLPYGLFPAQKFILKLYYGIELDNTNKTIIIKDPFTDKIECELTEKEYLKYLYDRGRCNINVQESKLRYELVLVLGRRAGKCLEEGSLIQTDGGIFRIEELGDPNGPMWQQCSHIVAQQHPDSRSRTEYFYNPGVCDVIRLTTQSGYTVCGTHTHRIKVIDESGNVVWKELKDINSNDYVGIRRGSDLWAKDYLNVGDYRVKTNKLREVVFPDVLDERWGRLLGILTGDGTWAYKNSICVTGGCEEFLGILENIYSELFDHYSVTRKKHRKSTCPKYPWNIRAFSKVYREFLHNLGWNWDATPTTKHVPWSILRSPGSVVAAYLSGLFEADGGLEGDGRTISLSSASLKLLNEVQILLNNFGITSRVRGKFNKKYQRNYYVLAILGYRSRVIFAEKIGFITDRKNLLLMRGIVSGSEGHSSTEGVPNLKSTLKSLIESIPRSKNNTPGVYGNRYRSWLKDACGSCAKPNSSDIPSYTRLSNIIECGKRYGASLEILEKLRELVELDYFWDRVKIIEHDKKRVYDLSVPEGKSYVAQGFLNHNSTLASIISAYELYKLLRRGFPQEYYGVPAGNEIRVLCIANDKEQASIVYGEMSGYINQVDYFKSSITHDTMSYMKFQTDQDKKKYGEGAGKRATIISTFKSSIAKGLRGRGTICVILDELAFFIDDGSCSRLTSHVFTNQGITTFNDIINSIGVDKSKPGWTECELGITQESKRRELTSHVYYGGVRKVFDLKTRSGYGIGATAEHRVKVMSPDGVIIWKYINDISIGDFIGINRSIDLWATEYFDTSKVARLFSVYQSRKDPTKNIKSFLDWIASIEDNTIMTRRNVAKKLDMKKCQLDRILNNLSKMGIRSWNKIRVSEHGGKSVCWRRASIKFDEQHHYDKRGIQLPDTLNEDYGLLLGLLVGDGTWNKKRAIQITGGCEELREFIESFFERMFIYSKLHRRYGKDTTCDVSPWDITVNSASLREFLRFLGYDKSKPRLKHVPYAIMKSPRSVVAAFLRGLFEADGGMEGYNNTNGLGKRTISFTTVSKTLALEVQMLLLNFGITCSLTSENDGSDKSFYTIHILGRRSRDTFSRDIGFITNRKNDALRSGLKVRRRDAYDVIPFQHKWLSDLVHSVPKSRPIRKGNNLRSRLTILCASPLNHKLNSDTSYYSVEEMVAALEEFKVEGPIVDHFKNLLETRYFWDPVVSITESESEVADLMVPIGNQYVAQGMTNHNSSAQRIYKAITPGIGQFSPKDPKNKHVAVGQSEGRIISISSPDAREGFFYNLYQLALTNDKASSNMLMIQAPTWEINPTLFKDYYAVEHAKDPKSFDTEHGASFSDRVRGWIENYKDLTECIDPNLKPQMRGLPREPFFAGVDFGIIKDGTAIVLSHIKDGKIEVAYHEVWYAGKNWKEINPHLTNPVVPYAATLQGEKRLDIDEIINWFSVLSKRFYIHKGIFDQWAGPIFEQRLHKNGLNQFEMKNYSVNDSSNVYQVAKMLMYARQLRMYDYPIPETLVDEKGGMHSPMIKELLELQSRSGGKNITVVEAPEIAGKHDDVSDALVRSLSLAVDYTKSNPGSLEVSVITHASQRKFQVPIGYRQFHRIRERMHGGRPKERTAPTTRSR
jgi:intein/homing endonuclease